MNAIRTLVLPIAALLLSVSVACADPITFNYSISGEAWNNSNPPNITSFQIGGNGMGVLVNPSPVTITADAFTDTLFAPTQGVFTNVPISVTVSLTDTTAKAVPGAVPKGTLVFNGLLSGQWNHAMDAWSLTSTLPSAESITLGSPGQFHTYTVGAPYLWNPSFGTLLVAASIQAGDYQPGRGPTPGTISAAPEPASFILAALALPAFLAGRRVWAARSSCRHRSAP